MLLVVLCLFTDLLDGLVTDFKDCRHGGYEINLSEILNCWVQLKWRMNLYIYNCETLLNILDSPH